MKKIYISFLFSLLVLGSAMAQNTVVVDPGFGKIKAAIAEVATNGGDDAVSNTVFVLKRGAEYEIDQRIQNETYTLTLVAESGDGDRPKVMPGVDGDGNSDRPFQPNNNLTLKGLYVTGFTKTGVSNNHIIRGGVEGTRIIIEDCHLDHDFASLMRLDGDNMKMYITNSIISHMSNPDKPGAANGLQDKSDMLDSLVIKNTTIYNVRNAVYTEAGGPNGYVEIDHCTFVNVGKTALELNETIKSKVTNNLFINVGYNGAYPTTDSLFAVKLNPLPESLAGQYTQEAEISNNNFYMDPALIAALPDTVDASFPMNAHAASFADETAFLNEAIAFTAAPPSVLPLLGIWADPESTYEYENVDQNPAYDFSYDNSHASFTGSTDGVAIGDPNWFKAVSSIFSPKFDDGLQFSIYPNPVKDYAVISFNSKKQGDALVEILNITGAVIRTINKGRVESGNNSFNLSIGDLQGGIYMARLTVNGESSTRKIIVR